MRRLFSIIWVLMLGGALSLSGQQIHPSTPPPPPPPETPAAQPIDISKPPPPPPETPVAPPEPVFDPLHAGRSVEVGTFYLKNGKYDAAIERFVEAAQYEPTMAKPWRLLGEAYEKKGAYPSALESYRKYLEIF